MNTPIELESPPPMPDGERLYSIKAVAAYFGVSDKTVRRMLDEGELHSVKIRGSHRIRWSEVQKRIER